MKKWSLTFCIAGVVLGALASVPVAFANTQLAQSKAVQVTGGYMESYRYQAYEQTGTQQVFVQTGTTQVQTGTTTEQQSYQVAHRDVISKGHWVSGWNSTYTQCLTGYHGSPPGCGYWTPDVLGPVYYTTEYKTVTVPVYSTVPVGYYTTEPVYGYVWETGSRWHAASVIN